MKQKNAHDIVAFAVVELNSPLPYEVLNNLSPTDQLYKSLLDAWKEKQKREDARIGLLCAVIANCMGGGKKKYEPSDFIPKEPKPIIEQESEIKSQFVRYMESRKDK